MKGYSRVVPVPKGSHSPRRRDEYAKLPVKPIFMECSCSFWQKCNSNFNISTLANPPEFSSHEPRICSMANSYKAQRIPWVVVVLPLRFPWLVAALKWATANCVDLAWPNPVSPVPQKPSRQPGFSQDVLPPYRLMYQLMASLNGKRSAPIRSAHCSHDGISILWLCVRCLPLDKDIFPSFFLMVWRVGWKQLLEKLM